MAFVTGSSTHIEKRLKQSLQKENLSFKEQYLIYGGGKFSEAKYSADFLVYNGQKEVIVECDGRRYHCSKDKIKKLKERDLWLKNHGYSILHFNYDDIMNNIDSVISTIKKEIGLAYNKSHKLIYHPTTASLFPFKQVNYNNTEVFLYCYFIMKNNDLYLSYKFKHIKTNKWSEERFKYCKNININSATVTAFYLALLDLKRSTTVKIFYSSNLINNSIKNLRMLFLMLKQKNLILDSKLSFEYIKLTETSMFSNKTPIKIIYNLQSRCRQLTTNKHLTPSSLK